MNIAIAAGGTGGHIMPALAVARELRLMPECKSIVFVGSGRPLEAPLISGAGFDLEIVPAAAVLGGGLRAVFRLVACAPSAVLRLQRLYRRRQIDAVIGFGGYPSFFPVLVARLLGLSVVLHEQNVSSGVANRVLARLVKRVYAPPGAELRGAREIVELPNPVRAELYQTAAYSPPDAVQPLRLLVLGGSQGAQSLNSLICSLARVLIELNCEVVHQAGERNLEGVKESYAASGLANAKVFGFIDDLVPHYSWAHLVVCRAGAMTAAEVTAAARPAIFVPLEIAGGHQLANVRHAAQNGLALIVRQSPQAAGELEQILRDLRSHPQKLLEMSAALSRLRADAADRPAARIARDLISL